MNCKDPTNEKGFKSGKFDISQNNIVFVTSDALAHYILMMYEVAHKEEFESELQEAINAQTKDSNFIKSCMSQRKIDFEDVLSEKMFIKYWDTP